MNEPNEPKFAVGQVVMSTEQRLYTWHEVQDALQEVLKIKDTKK